MSNSWKEAWVAQPDEHRRLIVTNNIEAVDRFGQPSHVWLIDLLQEMDDPEGGYCGYSRDDLIQNITHWRYLDEALNSVADAEEWRELYQHEQDQREKLEAAGESLCQACHVSLLCTGKAGCVAISNHTNAAPQGVPSSGGGSTDPAVAAPTSEFKEMRELAKKLQSEYDGKAGCYCQATPESDPRTGKQVGWSYYSHIISCTYTEPNCWRCGAVLDHGYEKRYEAERKALVARLREMATKPFAVAGSKLLNEAADALEQSNGDLTP